MGSALLLAACTSGAATTETAADPQPSVTVNASKGAGLQAQALLQESTFSEPLASGYGDLEPAFGDSVTGVSDDARSVSFVFVCTGGAEASLRVGPDAEPYAVPCNSSFLKESIETAELEPGEIGFEATTDAQSGEYAYGFYPESKS